MGDAGVFLNFTQLDLSADQSIQFSLAGEPQVSASSGATVPARNPTNELLVGGGVLLLALAASLYTIRVWRQNQMPEEEDRTLVAEPEEASQLTAPAGADRRHELLQAIAALDDAYEEGELSQEVYETRRRKLKDELVAIWNA
jgi:hypothetical protein